MHYISICLGNCTDVFVHIQEVPDCFALRHTAFSLWRLCKFSFKAKLMLSTVSAALFIKKCSNHRMVPSFILFMMHPRLNARRNLINDIGQTIRNHATSSATFSLLILFGTLWLFHILGWFVRKPKHPVIYRISKAFLNILDSQKQAIVTALLLFHMTVIQQLALRLGITHWTVINLSHMPQSYFVLQFCIQTTFVRLVKRFRRIRVLFEILHFLLTRFPFQTAFSVHYIGLPGIPGVWTSQRGLNNNIVGFHMGWWLQLLESVVVL